MQEHQVTMSMNIRADTFRELWLKQISFVHWRRRVASWRWCQHVINAARSTAAIRQAKHVWSAWNGYRLYRRIQHQKLLMATIAAEATRLERTFVKWKSIARTMKHARVALQTTTLRLQLLLQISCFRYDATATSCS